MCHLILNGVKWILRKLTELAVLLGAILVYWWVMMHLVIWITERR